MKKITPIVCFCLIAAILFLTPIAYSKASKEDEFPLSTEEYKMILSLWQIDTFDGGVGSRGDYLSDLCLDFAKKGVYVMVSSYTVEGAKEKIEKGTLPDIISFGIGAPFVSEYAAKLSSTDFTGGEIMGETYAVPWCRGGYFLISKNEVNEHIDRLIVSKSAYNNPLAALFYSKYRAESCDIKESMAAVSEYLKTDGGVLLGTQRDVWRLIKRGVEFKAFPLEKFCDLYQYLAVTSIDKERFDKAKEVVDYICAESGENLRKVGMLPISGNFYEEPLGRYVTSNTEYTVSPFTATEILTETSEFLNGLKSENEIEQKLKNIVKHL